MHASERQRFAHRRTPKRGYGPAHRALRDAVFARDGWRCVRCRSREQLQLDHVDPAGPDSMANAQTLCRRCNLRKAQREASESRRASRR